MAGMSNADVAAVFHELAELLRIQGGDRHRAKAFHNVGKILENLPEPVARAVRYGTLARTPGVGAGTVHRVKQILRTGTCDDLKRLRLRIPSGVRELLALRGLGPSTVRLLHQQLGIRSIAQLEAAAHAGLLNDLPRLSALTVHNLLEEIAVSKARGGKIPLVEAEAALRPLMDRLRAADGCEQVSPGGSVRRQRAMIGDLDLLASSSEPEIVIEAFLTEPNASAVLTRRTDGGSIRLNDQRQVDLWVFPPESWGAGLHAFTGNKEHNINLRTRAGRLGLHISEHGVSNRKTGQRLNTGLTEENIYAAVQLPFIPVPLRQNLGEIEAAEHGNLPVPIQPEDLRGDLHMHTTWSDGTGSIGDMARAAAALGLEYIAITDHSRSLQVANGLTPERLRDQRRALARTQESFGSVHLLAGIEVDILADGRLDLDASALRPLDWVVGSVHGHFDQDDDTMTSRLIQAMETGLIDCIGHPFGRKLGRREPHAIDFERLLDAARRLDVALEINGNPRRMDLSDTHCRQAREAGVTLVIDTDAHSPAHLSRRTYALAMAQRGWLERKHILNTRPVDSILTFRRDRLRRHGIVVGATLASTPQKPPSTPALAPSDGGSAIDTAPSTGPAVAALANRLAAGPLDADLRRRLEAFLVSGSDPDLEAALAAQTTNPIQRAFDLLIG